MTHAQTGLPIDPSHFIGDTFGLEDATSVLGGELFRVATGPAITIYLVGGDGILAPRVELAADGSVLALGFRLDPPVLLADSPWGPGERRPVPPDGYRLTPLAFRLEGSLYVGSLDLETVDDGPLLRVIGVELSRGKR